MTHVISGVVGVVVTDSTVYTVVVVGYVVVVVNGVDVACVDIVIASVAAVIADGRCVHGVGVLIHVVYRFCFCLCRVYLYCCELLVLSLRVTVSLFSLFFLGFALSRVITRCNVYCRCVECCCCWWCWYW